MQQPFLVFLITGGSLSLLIVLWYFEQKYGRRFVLPQVRAGCDRALERAEQQLQRLSFWYRQLIVRWGFRYGLHLVLRGLLSLLAALYDRVVVLFERNLQVTKQLRRERKRWRKGDQ